MLIFSLLLIPGRPSAARQSTPDAVILFARDGMLWGASLQDGALIEIGAAPAGGVPGFDVYTREAAPLSQSAQQPLDQGFGFFHGVWHPDGQQFAYLVLNPPQYEVWLQPAGESEAQRLHSGTINAGRGYLDPVGWAEDGALLLLDRMLLHHLHAVNLWRLDPATGDLRYHLYVPLPRLSGRSALLPDGRTLFLGFHLEQQAAHLLDLPSGQLATVPVALGLAPRGFDYHPLAVLGAIPTQTLPELSAQLNSASPAPSVRPAPFLRWPLPDDVRRITCYPDSPWTAAHFEVTCPGLSAPRQYEGHQGTDISGKPNGLPPGTPVYPSAPGVVVATHRTCGLENPSCNGAYGNTVTLEHVLITGEQAQTFYTGYGHLQTVLVDDYAPIENLTTPLAVSGATGVGGPHLHFEVRTPHGWVDPWDAGAGESLWLGGNTRPLALVFRQPEAPTPTPPASTVLATCTTFAGNNIRGGPGTDYPVVGETTDGQEFDVVEIVSVSGGLAPGDWYRVRYADGEGWLWSGLMTCP